MSESELVWTTGIGSIIRQTGGLIKDGGLLQKAVCVIKDKVISVQQIQMYVIFQIIFCTKLQKKYRINV